MQYSIIPTIPPMYIAVNYKCLTTSLDKTIANHYYSETVANIFECQVCGVGEEPHLDEHVYKGIVPKTETPDGETIMLMREPVDKFISTCAMFGVDINTALSGMLEQEYFLPQSRFKADSIYSFPDQIETFCSKLSLPYPLPVCNEGTSKKPVPTKKQIAAIEKHYADDVKLYNSL